MRTVDTSAWIEWLLESATGRKVAREFPEREECIVPTIVQLELANWLTRIEDEQRADEIVASTRKCIVVERSPPTSRPRTNLPEHCDHEQAQATDDPDAPPTFATEEMALYLDAFLEDNDGDAAFIARALGDIAHAPGMHKVRARCRRVA